MQTIKISEVQIPESRQRRHFAADALLALRDSIAAHGLFHAIVLRDDGRTLVSGERRLRAVGAILTPYAHDNSMVAMGEVPYTRLCDLSPLELREAELEENTIRWDLSWQEHSRAVAELHRLRVAQAEAAGETHTKANTVEELLGRPGASGDATAMVSNAILVADHLDDPAVAGAKTQKEALNLVKKKLTADYNAELAENMSRVKSPHTLLPGDCRQVLTTLPDAHYDVICTDPPYGIGADRFAPMSGSDAGTVHEYEDSRETALSVWRTIFTEGARVCKPQAHLYMFFDIRYWATLCVEATLAGWTVWPRPLIWYKPSGGMLGDSSHGPRMAYEPILFASRGDKKVTGTYLDVIDANPAAELHAAEKPVEVIINLLRRSAIPGSRVLDPCCGSGTIFPAAQFLSLFATGIELVEKHYNTALVRMVGDATP